MLRSMNTPGKQELSVKVAQDEKYLGMKMNNVFQEVSDLGVADLWSTLNGFSLQLTVLLENHQVVSK